MKELFSQAKMIRETEQVYLDMIKHQGQKYRVQVVYFAALQQPMLQKILSPAIVGVSSASLKTEKITDAMGSMVFGGLGSKVKILILTGKPSSVS